MTTALYHLTEAELTELLRVRSCVIASSALLQELAPAPYIGHVATVLDMASESLTDVVDKAERSRTIQ